MPILIIEDEFLIAAEMRSHLERGPFGEIEHAATERDALSAIAARDWTAAVLDANLAGKKVDRIAAALTERKIPFVIVTGYGREALPQSVAGVSVIGKPFHPKTLVDTVSRLCAEGKV